MDASVGTYRVATPLSMPTSTLWHQPPIVPTPLFANIWRGLLGRQGDRRRVDSFGQHLRCDKFPALGDALQAQDIRGFAVMAQPG